MKSFLIGLFLWIPATLLAQVFETEFQVLLEAGPDYQSVRWADFDNDSLPDVLVTASNVAGETIFSFFRNTGSGFSSQPSINSLLKDIALELTDLNGDNRIDIVATGIQGSEGVTVSFVNQGGFIFQPTQILPVAGSFLAFSDLDQDGRTELLISGSDGATPFLDIYKRSGDQWNLVHDSLDVKATWLACYDFDSDTDQDLFISGTDAGGNPASRLFLNERKFYLKSTATIAEIAGTGSVSDLDHDGRLDIFLSGLNGSGNAASAIFFNSLTDFIISDTLPALSDAMVFTGDMNTDGKCDISMYGTNPDGDSVNLIVFAGGTTDTMAVTNVRSQAFGDFDRDGDLDLVQLITGPSEGEMTFIKNIAVPLNQPPGTPYNPIAVNIYNRFFMHWLEPGDDHTPVRSITYDVHLSGAASDVQSSAFDQIHFNRLLVSHGNTGTANYLLVRPSVPVSGFAVQAVDNAYYGNKTGVCSGGGGPGGGGPGNCLTLTENEVKACKSERIVLAGGEGALWFSFQKGFLFEGASLVFTAQASDTIFSVQPLPDTGRCAIINVYLLNVSDSLSLVKDELRYVCDGSLLRFEAEPGFETEWSSSGRGFLSNDLSISFDVTGPDTLKLKLVNGGCSILRRTTLVISEPVLTLEGEAFQILKGESVQLRADGEGTFLWSPQNGLDNPLEPEPIASPLVTTEYTVTLTDSIGCTVNGKVLVVVEQTAFIPNLFTPNDDGKNDDLKVYGLSDADGFIFSIYNREGSLVYSTDSVSEVTSGGWNGMVSGVKQPAGVYYWRVKGETAFGTKILLNGKTSGSIVLIR